MQSHWRQTGCVFYEETGWICDGLLPLVVLVDRETPTVSEAVHEGVGFGHGHGEEETVAGKVVRGE